MGTVKRSVLKYFTVLGCFILLINVTYAQAVKIVAQGQPCSIRGLSVVDNKVAWVSGSNGYVGITLNGGQSWRWQQVKGFEKSDFRDIEAFSDMYAVIMSSGIPALMMQTNDGGITWETNYRNDDKAFFLDGMDFSDHNHGVIYGDPINNEFVILETTNGGKTWLQLKDGPDAMPGEAAFAASGTGIQTENNNSRVTFVTGGPVSRLFVRQANKWQLKTLPLACGQDSKGAFAETAGGGTSVILGGNYKQLNNRDSTACYYDARVQQYVLSQTMPGGFQSGVSWLGKSSFLSTGTSGTNITFDGGKNWRQIDQQSFNVCKKAKHGTLILLAGNKGKIASFKAYLLHN